MRLLFFLAVWKRPEITEISFMGLNRLKKLGLFPIEVLAVISENSMKPLCKKYGIDYVYYKNDPVGEKKNAGLTYALQNKKFDFLIELGSDDLLKNELLELYRPHFQTRELFGIDYFVHLNSQDGECRQERSDHPFGLGRCMSREMLERVAGGVEIEGIESVVTQGMVINAGQRGFCSKVTACELQTLKFANIVSEPKYKLWNDEINQGLDNNSYYYMARFGVMHKLIKCENALGIDIKSEQNIWPFNPNFGEAVDLKTVVDGLSGEEKSALFAMIKRNKSKLIETAVA